MRCVIACAVLAGCTFQNGTVPSTSDAAPDGDAPTDATTDASPMFDVAHLEPATEAMLTSAADLMIDATTMIDTTNGTIVGPTIAGVTIIPSVPQSGGPDVMVIQARTITITSNVRVLGDRPLILVATDTIIVDSTLDGSANLAVPGPGGGGPKQGMGAGRDSLRGVGIRDTGASGASYGTAGGAGGAVDATAGPLPPAVYGGPTLLAGGSGGGNGMPAACNSVGGGGGGGIQLSAAVSITITGAIHVGGGGGQRGVSCGGEGSSGGGGGSGGMVYLQAPMLLGSGALGGNGGGGGAGAGPTGGAVGSSGGNATVSTGGTAGVNADVDGGDGGVGANGTNPGATAPTQIDNGSAGDNAGGGGGGVGRIYTLTSGTAPAYAASPPMSSG